jgi:hypothetical protein
MDAEQALYLAQARSDLRAFDLLTGANTCHRVHYLQMMTEKLAKAYFWRRGQPLKKRHDYFVRFMRAAGGRGDVGRAVGIQPSAHWQSYVDAVLPAAHLIEQMAPAEAGDGPNAEYPWPHDAPTTAPATYVFPAWSEMQTPRGKKFLNLLRLLVERFEAYG